jgi:hypothetical protein
MARGGLGCWNPGLTLERRTPRSVHRRMIEVLLKGVCHRKANRAFISNHQGESLPLTDMQPRSVHQTGILQHPTQQQLSGAIPAVRGPARCAQCAVGERGAALLTGSSAASFQGFCSTRPSTPYRQGDLGAASLSAVLIDDSSLDSSLSHH